jgi:hypothetical protein
MVSGCSRECLQAGYIVLIGSESLLKRAAISRVGGGVGEDDRKTFIALRANSPPRRRSSMELETSRDDARFHDGEAWLTGELGATERRRECPQR